jgi:hypothetical protein
LDERDEPIARNEALFREVNERIAESAERFDSERAEFVCECADQEGTERVEATLVEYERVRATVRSSSYGPSTEPSRSLRPGVPVR